MSKNKATEQSPLDTLKPFRIVEPAMTTIALALGHASSPVDLTVSITLRLSHYAAILSGDRATAEGIARWALSHYAAELAACGVRCAPVRTIAERIEMACRAARDTTVAERIEVAS